MADMVLAWSARWALHSLGFGAVSLQVSILSVWDVECGKYSYTQNMHPTYKCNNDWNGSLAVAYVCVCVYIVLAQCR